MAHKSTSNWYKEASRVVVFTFDNGYIASALEPLVIADFEPKYNKDLTGGEVHWKEKLEIRRTTTFLFDKYTHEEDTIII